VQVEDAVFDRFDDRETRGGSEGVEDLEGAEGSVVGGADAYERKEVKGQSSVRRRKDERRREEKMVDKRERKDEPVSINSTFPSQRAVIPSN
jgi:hypothetical protein